jgi:hypothetical protein
MSTILKALRRLELEKSAQELGRPLKDEVTSAPEAGSRRRFPLLALMIAAGALGLGLGSSLLWLWPREGTETRLAESSRAQPRTAVVSAPPVQVAAPAALPTPSPEPSIPSPEVSVTSAPLPPEVALAPPVAVVSRPEPTRAIAPEPPIAEPPDPVAAKPAAPVRGSLPPFARRRAPAAAEPPPAASEPPVQKVARVEPAAAVEKVARVEPSPPAEKVARVEKPPPAEQLARAELPGVLVSRTVWHPQRDRRLAMVSLEGGAPRELHEGDAIGSLVVSEIGPSGVVFLHDGVELRRRVGAKN